MEHLTALIAQNSEAGRRACKKYFEPQYTSPIAGFVLANVLLDEEDFEAYALNVAYFGNEAAVMNIAPQFLPKRRDLLDDMFEMACGARNLQVAIALVEHFGVVPPDDGRAVCYAAKASKRLLFLLFDAGLTVTKTNEDCALRKSLDNFDAEKSQKIVEAMMRQGRTQQEIADGISIYVATKSHFSDAFNWCLSIGAFRTEPDLCMRVLCEEAKYECIEEFMKQRRVPLSMGVWRKLSEQRPPLADVAISLGLADWRSCYTSSRVFQSRVAEMDRIRARFLLGRPTALPEDLRQQMVCLVLCLRRMGRPAPIGIILDWAVVCYTRWLHHHSLVPYEAVRPSLRCTACNFRILGQ